MRIYKTLIFISLSLFVLLFQSCSLPADDEAAENPEGEDTITSELPWEGETDKFTINAKEGIRLNDPQEDAGTAYATFPSSSVKTPVGNSEYALLLIRPPTIMPVFI